MAYFVITGNISNVLYFSTKLFSWSDNGYAPYAASGLFAPVFDNTHRNISFVQEELRSSGLLLSARIPYSTVQNVMITLQDWNFVKSTQNDIPDFRISHSMRRSLKILITLVTIILEIILFYYFKEIISNLFCKKHRAVIMAQPLRKLHATNELDKFVDFPYNDAFINGHTF
ncbi:hypothetical protein LOAG_06378 [Loa loa]|uniref:Uncharacterized protein n=1 Tax=Loa loa TaxID=7209 RepID=A0A1S0TZM5_LOALO|nr:hypothetical protein LOAG_06378 [Loa loa]EFO22105.1 hypothetical protein LOAG_06378 [Loa loa]